MEKKDSLEELEKKLEEISVKGNKDVWRIVEKESNNRDKGKSLTRKPGMSYKGFVSTILVCAISCVVGVLVAAVLLINR